MEEELNALRHELNLRRQADDNLNVRLHEQAQVIQALTDRIGAQEAQIHGEVAAQADGGGAGDGGIAERIAQLLQENGTGRARVKPPRPPTFSGDARADVEDWLFKVGQYFVTANVPTNKQVLFAASLLLGSAASWWRAQWEQDEGAPVCNEWNVFRQTLIEQFKFISGHTRAREELYSTPVRAFRDMSEYCRFFRNKVIQIGNMSVEEQIFSFCRKLEPTMRAEIMSKKPDSLDACMYTAEVLATAQREWNRPLGARSQMFKRKRYRPTFANGQSMGSANANGPTPMELDYVQVRGQNRYKRRGQYPKSGPPPRNAYNQRIRCFLCRKVGHPVSKCPNRMQDTQLHGVHCASVADENPTSADTKISSTQTKAEDIKVEEILENRIEPDPADELLGDLMLGADLSDLDLDFLAESPLKDTSDGSRHEKGN